MGRLRKYKTNASRQRAYRQRQKPKVYHRHESDLRGTPQELSDKWHQKFHFTLDACAIASNAKCDHYFSPAENGLQQDWSGQVVWCNPPYSEVEQWIAKAYEAAQQGATVVCLTYAKTETRWFQRYVLPLIPLGDVDFLPGRVKFVGPRGVQDSAPSPSMVVIFRPSIGI